MPQMLYLLRHASAREIKHSEDDSERPLDAAGQAQARRLGIWMRDNNHIPDTLLCSSSQRTVDTLELIITEMSGAAPKIYIEPTLYLASAKQLLQRIHAVPQVGQNLLVIAHNPGIAELATELSISTLRGPRKIELVPPCTLIIFEIPVEWQQLTWGKANLVSIIYPSVSG